MMSHLEAVLGIAISLFLFYISYRQTIGASKERAQVANDEIDSVVFKRTVLEGLSVTPLMIRQLIEGKALLHKVRVGDLHTVEEVLSLLLTATLESDFVPEAKRVSILQTITGFSTSPERETTKEEVIEAETTAAWKTRSELVMVLMAITASLLGGLSSILPRLDKVSGHLFSLVDRQELYTALLVFATSLVLLSLSLWILRFRQSEEQSVRSAEAISIGSLEREVLKIFQQYHIPTSIADPESAYDFNAEIGGKKILIEVKNWSRRVPLSLIRMTIRRMRNLVDSGKGQQSLLVTKYPIPFQSIATVDPRIKLVTLDELRNYLAHPSPPN